MYSGYASEVIGTLRQKVNILCFALKSEKKLWKWWGGGDEVLGWFMSGLDSAALGSLERQQNGQMRGCLRPPRLKIDRQNCRHHPRNSGLDASTKWANEGVPEAAKAKNNQMGRIWAGDKLSQQYGVWNLWPGVRRALLRSCILEQKRFHLGRQCQFMTF